MEIDLFHNDLCVCILTSNCNFFSKLEIILVRRTLLGVCVCVRQEGARLRLCLLSMVRNTDLMVRVERHFSCQLDPNIGI